MRDLARRELGDDAAYVVGYKGLLDDRSPTGRHELAHGGRECVAGHEHHA